MATMADVARLAGVNPSTVSHVLNRTRNVSDDTREAVLRAVRDTGYRPNALARSLARSSTATLGLACRFVADPHFADVVRLVDGAARAAGYSLALADTHDDGEEELRAVGRLVDRRVDGVVLAPTASADEHALPFLLGRGVPTVLVDRTSGLDVDQVTPEGTAATALLTTHLADLGHRRVAHVAGLPGVSSTRERSAGWREVVTARGLDPSPALLLDGGGEARRAEAAVRAAFAGADRPSAVVVGNGAMTLGVLRGLRGLGLRVPRDVAVVCYDDPEWADVLEPRLTTVAQDLPAVAGRAVQLLLERVGGAVGPARREQVAPHLRHRSSCGCPGGPGTPDARGTGDRGKVNA